MYTKYQIAKAQSISLLDYVVSRGYELIYSHSDVRLKEHIQKQQEIKEISKLPEKIIVIEYV